ncbi:F-box/LRR-repeat/kelch-repeat protein [Cardamine amara subsp. amara]|uniref:F-box/LRR-repeat/kelch-repeat protein n=1 Tax=Cardamine amara subsp. amara TaxID=228776 RepID=A0ABD1AWC1_CARAN
MEINDRIPTLPRKQLKQRQESGDPDVLMVFLWKEVIYDQSGKQYVNVGILRTLVLGSSSSIKIPIPLEKTLFFVCKGNCDGLVCLYNPHNPGFVVNPTTRWYRPLPLSRIQQLMIKIESQDIDIFIYPNYTLPYPGFGKDKIKGTYKQVWLYNSSEFLLENATTCEVFDFGTNAWRYVTPASPYGILAHQEPVYINGSLYWFTKCEETKVLALDLHTETFQIISKAPFANANPYNVI